MSYAKKYLTSNEYDQICLYFKGIDGKKRPDETKMSEVMKSGVKYELRGEYCGYPLYVEVE